MSCCSACAHGRKCSGKKKRRNGRRARRRNPWRATTGWTPGPKAGTEVRVHEFSGGANRYVGAEMTRKVGAIGPVTLTLWKSASDKRGRVVGRFKSIFPAMTALATKYSPKVKRKKNPLTRREAARALSVARKHGWFARKAVRAGQVGVFEHHLGRMKGMRDVVRMFIDRRR